jgi:hypothetical protein
MSTLTGIISDILDLDDNKKDNVLIYIYENKFGENNIEVFERVKNVDSFSIESIIYGWTAYSIDTIKEFLVENGFTCFVSFASWSEQKRVINFINKFDFKNNNLYVHVDDNYLSETGFTYIDIEEITDDKADDGEITIDSMTTTLCRNDIKHIDEDYEDENALLNDYCRIEYERW